MGCEQFILSFMQIPKYSTSLDDVTLIHYRKKVILSVIHRPTSYLFFRHQIEEIFLNPTYSLILGRTCLLSARSSAYASVKHPSGSLIFRTSQTHFFGVVPKTDLYDNPAVFCICFSLFIIIYLSYQICNSKYVFNIEKKSLSHYIPTLEHLQRRQSFLCSLSKV